jgi:hypothetical protein
MRQFPVATALALAMGAPSVSLASTEAEIAELRATLNEMKAHYERRIRELETRLDGAEKQASQRDTPAKTATAKRAKPPTGQPGSRPATAEGSGTGKAAPTAPTAPPAPGAEVASTEAVAPPAQPAAKGTAPSFANAFNPQISVILNGNYYQDGVNGTGAALVGEAYQPSLGVAEHDGHDHGHTTTEGGFNLAEAELAFSATIDPYFDGTLFLSIDGEGSVALEEGYFQTRSLPYGLTLKGGKFLSDFGYVNRQHPHQWDFADQNLPYLNLLGDHGLQDIGLQLTWLPQLPFYALLGVELANLADEGPFGATLGADDRVTLNLDDTADGPNLWTAFAKFAPDLGHDHTLQFGLSYAHARQQQGTFSLEHAHEAHEEELPWGLEGDADLWGLDLVYQYDGGGSQGHRRFKLQSEYLRMLKHTRIRSGEPDLLGDRLDFTTDGLYAQATYGIWPKWTLGLRYDVLGLTNKVQGGVNEHFGSSDRWTADLTWSLSEFSRFRLQFAHNDILVSPDERERFNAVYLQFIMSLGTHGAHKL